MTTYYLTDDNDRSAAEEALVKLLVRPVHVLRDDLDLGPVHEVELAEIGFHGRSRECRCINSNRKDMRRFTDGRLASNRRSRGRDRQDVLPCGPSGPSGWRP